MQVALPADRKLPALAAALDAAAMARRFAKLWRSAEDVALRSCTRASTEYEPEVRCIATYELGGEARGWARRTFGVATVLPSGIGLRLLEEDPALPQLKALLQPRELLEQLAILPRAVIGDAPVSNCRVLPVRYKPGRSCVARVLLSTSQGPRALFVKVVAGRSQEVAAALREVHEAGLRDPELPRVPPAARLADLDAIVQPEIAGDELGRLAFDTTIPAAHRDAVMARAGRAVAALHDAGLRPPAVTDDDLDELSSGRQVLAPLAPDLVAPYDAALAALLSRPPARGEGVPSHGALRTDQVLVGPDGVALVDLDGFRRSPAARDLGNLLAYLQWRVIRGAPRAELVDGAARRFVEGYSGARRPPGEGALSRYKALSLLKITVRRYRDLSMHQWPFCGGLVAAAGALLGTDEHHRRRGGRP